MRYVVAVVLGENFADFSLVSVAFGGVDVRVTRV